MDHRTIVTVTINPCIDKSAEVPLVVAEHKLRCTEPKREPGGGGINVSRAIAKLGGRSKTMWSSGGVIGTLLSELLDDDGLDHTAVEVDATTRENLIVTESETGRQFRFGMPGGPMSDGDLERWRGALADLEPPDFLVLSGSLPPGAPADLFAQLAATAASPTQVLVDTSGAALSHAIDSGHVDIIKPNLAELAVLLGERISGDEQIRAAARSLAIRGKMQLVLVSLGGGGAIAVTPDWAAAIRAPTVQIRSKVGAGDSSVAGLILALARGEDLSSAARRAVASGAAAVMTPGTELCRGADADELFRQMAASES